MRLAGLDLNLLVVFDAVLVHGNVTRAARRLGISQSAASGAIARLRVALRDPLFVRVPGGVEPTARAVQLGGEVRRLLADLQGAIDGAAFDPASSDRTFALGLAEPLAVALVPRLAAALAEEAPGVRLALTTLLSPSVVPALDDGLVELAVAPLPEPPPRIGAADLFDTELVLLARPGHPALAEASLDAYCAARHLVVATHTPRSPIDDRLEALGRHRRVVVTVNSFLAAAFVVRASDLVCAVPGRFAQTVGDMGVAHGPLPDELRTPFSLRVLWSARRGLSPATAWLRDRLVALERERSGER